MALVKRSPVAEEDLWNIWYYIAVENQSRLNADRFLKKLDHEFKKLSKSPMIGTDRSHRMPNMRGWPFGNYLIFYMPITDGVEIVRVINAKRDMGKQRFQ